MGRLFRRFWRYLTAALTGKFNELADPKVQLEQAIVEAQDQHRRLKEQAANVIANQKQTELKLERAVKELETLSGNAQQALLLADEARTSGNEQRAAEYERAAETIATQLIAVEKEVEDLKGLHLGAVEATQQAKDAVEQNASLLQQKLSEKQELLSQLDQAKMAEQMNDAMATLSESVGQDVPTFDEVRDKLERRLARAQGRAELERGSVGSRMAEIEKAQRNVQAQTRLSELRTQLGLSGASPATGDEETQPPSPETGTRATP